MNWSEIRTYRSWGQSYTVELNDVEHCLERWKKDQKVDLDPYFQRRHVWTEEKQKAYVEYLLKGGVQNRNILFNCRDWGKAFEQPIVLVDGKQRLQAVRLFLGNKLSVFGGNYLQDFEKPKGKVPRSYCLNFYVNDMETEREVLQFYLDHNSGGVAHTEEELSIVEGFLQAELKKLEEK